MRKKNRTIQDLVKIVKYQVASCGGGSFFCYKGGTAVGGGLSWEFYSTLKTTK